MSRALTVVCVETAKELDDGAKVPTKTLMNFSHLWTTHGFSLLLNCLFEYSHLNAEPATQSVHTTGLRDH